MSQLEKLRTWLRDADSVIVAFSGGVDSALLADVAHEVLGERSLAATAVSPSLAPRERSSALELAASRGWRHIEVATDEHERPGYIENSTDRCFHCKDALFDVLSSIADLRGGVVCVGTNLDDLGTHRPGLRAVAEHGVAQPLVEAGFSKADVREAAAARGLPVADKPATPCLASRIAYGIQVTPQRLARVAAAENLLWDRGVGDLRVRDLGDRARIEVPESELHLVRASDIEGVKKLGFVEVDVAPLRSGSLLQLVTPADASNAEDMG